MFFQSASERLGLAREMAVHASPSFGLICDSLRLRRSDYVTRHRASDLSFNLRPNVGDWFIFFECCIRQDYFPEGIRISPGDTVLDIGGNFGAFTLMASTKVGDNGAVHCYEPSPESFQRILGHIQLNQRRNISANQCAVGADTGAIEFFLHPKSALSSTHFEIDGRMMNGARKISVPKIGIHDVMRRIDGPIALAKIDCEGAEYEIMREIDESDLSRIKAIVMETHKVPGYSRDEIFDRLTKAGYKISGRNPFVAIRK